MGTVGADCYTEGAQRRMHVKLQHFQFTKRDMMLPTATQCTARMCLCRSSRVRFIMTNTRPVRNVGDVAS